MAATQSKSRAAKGPRALGLLELAANGRAHLIPVVILEDGKFFDAGAYKAAPVPMALEPGTVYEALRTGVSLGLFTVTQPGQLKKSWIAEGTWQAAGSAPAIKKSRGDEAPKMGDQDEPPRLRHSSASPEEPKKDSTPEAKTETPAASSTASPAAPATAAAAPAAPVAQAQAAEEDPDRPRLERGGKTAKRAKPAPAKPTGKTAEAKPADGKPAAGAKTSGSAQDANVVQLIPAISDAGGPDPRPYKFDWKADEEAAYRKKILVIAAQEITAKSKLAETQEGATTVKKSRAAKAAGPVFDDVQLKAFDLSNSNEPILVLQATAHLPAKSAAEQAGTLRYYLTLVVRDDIYAELHKVYSEVTDDRHLDATPRMELVDAVDMDGDGKGELLFRRTLEGETTYSIYRVIGDRWWPLYEGRSGN